MKKWLTASVTLCLLLMTVGTVFAAEDITVYVDEKRLEFDQPPILENGRVLVPFRAIFEALGAGVSWDQATLTATAIRELRQVTLTVGSTTAYRGDEVLTLDVGPKLLNGRVLVPLRFVSESFDATVEWDGEHRTVRITSRYPLSWRPIDVSELPEEMQSGYRMVARGKWSNPQWDHIYIHNMVHDGNTYVLFAWANRPTTGYTVRIESLYNDRDWVDMEWYCAPPEPGAKVERKESHPYVAAVIEGKALYLIKGRAAENSPGCRQQE